LAYSDEATAASPTLMQETAEAWGVPVTPAAGSRAGAQKKTKPRDVILKVRVTSGPFDPLAGDVRILAWEGSPAGKQIWTHGWETTADGRIESPTIRTAADVVTVKVFVRVGGLDPLVDQPATTFERMFVLEISGKTALLKIEVETKGKGKNLPAPNADDAIHQLTVELRNQGFFTLTGKADLIDPGIYNVVVSYFTGKLLRNTVGG
jgi:hypothetical protein